MTDEQRKKIEEAAAKFSNEDTYPIPTAVKSAIFEIGAEFALSLSTENEAEKWISVMHSLPENNVNVLCYTGWKMTENSWSEGSDQDRQWFRKVFTHWRPLPPRPPKTSTP
jgi:hypothetical protein